MSLISVMSTCQNHSLILGGLYLWFAIIFLCIYLWLFYGFPSSSHLLDFLVYLGRHECTSKTLCLLNNPQIQQFYFVFFRHLATTKSGFFLYYLHFLPFLRLSVVFLFVLD